MPTSNENETDRDAVAYAIGMEIGKLLTGPESIRPVARPQCLVIADAILATLAQRGVSREAISRLAVDALSIDGQAMELQAKLASAVARAEAAEQELAEEREKTVTMSRAERDRLVAEAAALREALREAFDMVADWGSYASDYFRSKNDLVGDLAKITAALASSIKKRQGDGT